MSRAFLGTRLLAFLVAAGIAGVSILSLSGCAAFGVIAQALPPTQILPQYKGLKGQSVAVMVWTDRGIKDDWPDLSLDTAAGLEHKLEAARPHFPDYFKDTTFPVSSLSIVRDQEDHPEWDGVPITDIARQLKVTRLIYVEVNTFQTRSDAATDLYKGNIIGSVKVVDIHDGEAKVVYTEDNIHATFPSDGPDEGVLNAGDDKIYTGTLDAFTTELANRFCPHDEKKD